MKTKILPNGLERRIGKDGTIWDIIPNKFTIVDNPIYDTPVPRSKFFKELDKFLEDYGFKPTLLPWRYESDRYTIVQVEDGNENQDINPTIYTISITSDDEYVYRGRLFDSTHAAYIFGMVAEHRLLTGKKDFPKLPIIITENK
jgi:hypothetical protein